MKLATNEGVGYEDISDVEFLCQLKQTLIHGYLLDTKSEVNHAQ